MSESRELPVIGPPPVGWKREHGVIAIAIKCPEEGCGSSPGTQCLDLPGAPRGRVTRYHPSRIELARATPVDDPDCRTCGACCYAKPWGDGKGPFVSLDPEEIRDYFVRFLPLLTAMPKSYQGPLGLRIENGRCAAFEGEAGKCGTCTIHENRPRICRDFEAGSAHCRLVRYRMGVIS